MHGDAAGLRGAGEGHEDILQVRFDDCYPVSLVGQERLVGQGVVDQQMHALAEQRGVAHTRHTPQVRKPSRGVRSRQLEPPGAGRTDLGQGLELVGATDHEQLRHVDVADVRAALGLVHVVRGHEQRHPASRQLEEQVPQVAPRHGVDPGGGLVEKEELRFVNQSAGQRQALLPATGEGTGELVHAVVDPGEPSDLALALAEPFGAQPVDPSVEIEVLIDRKIGVQTEVLGHIADSTLDRLGRRRRVVREHRRPTARGRQHSAEHANDR